MNTEQQIAWLAFQQSQLAARVAQLEATQVKLVDALGDAIKWQGVVIDMLREANERDGADWWRNGGDDDGA